MTWKHLLLGAVHNIITGGHRSAANMLIELNQLVVWWPPETLRRDCAAWVARCKLCTSVHHQKKQEPMYQSIRSYKPFLRIQIDLMEVKPEGQDGERYIFTTIDVATRYPFLRCTNTRDTIELACLLLDIFLDMGVIPAIVQSDNEFCTLALEELCQSLGSSQIFSTALHPQSQGIVERSHRDLREYMAKFIEAYARANPRKWARYVRWLEYKL